MLQHAKKPGHCLSVKFRFSPQPPEFVPTRIRIPSCPHSLAASVGMYGGMTNGTDDHQIIHAFLSKPLVGAVVNMTFNAFVGANEAAAIAILLGLFELFFLEPPSIAVDVRMIIIFL